MINNDDRIATKLFVLAKFGHFSSKSAKLPKYLCLRRIKHIGKHVVVTVDRRRPRKQLELGDSRLFC